MNFLFGCSSDGSPAGKNSSSWKNISFNASDDVLIKGRFIAPADAKGVFILLHGLGSTGEEWSSFAKKLKAEGFGYLSYDARGHGSSIYIKGSEKLDYRNFKVKRGPSSEWLKMIDDLGYAVDFAKRKSGIDGKKIVLAGASLGANVALNYAFKNKEIKRIILLSPGLNYVGVSTEHIISNLSGRELLIAVSEEDRYAFDSSLKLNEEGRAKNTVKFIKLKNKGHGVSMLSSGLDGEIVEWASP